MLKIKISNSFVPEKKYIIDVLVKEFLGLEYEIVLSDKERKSYEIQLPNGKQIIIEDYFFSKFNNDLDYLSDKNIPTVVKYAKCQFLSEDDIPVIYGDRENLIVESEKEIKCKIDIFASSFFMLTRWEEYVNKMRDEHDRFPATASIAYKNGFLERPVVNEYLELLWSMMTSLCSNIKRKNRVFQQVLTHDVDHVSYFKGKNILFLIKTMGGDVLKRKSIRMALKSPLSWYSVNYLNKNYDRYNTFDWLMDISEKNNLKSCFNFMSADKGQLDDGYDPRQAFANIAIKQIIDRGHEIGFHPGYCTYNSPERWKLEYIKFKDVVCEYKIKGGRQHVLRFNAPFTWRLWNNSGLEYDSTVGYADHVGFRSGTCYEYPVFDFLERKKMDLKERPLLVMDCTVTDERYMNLGYSIESSNCIKLIKLRCRNYNGMFTLLWHNSRLITNGQRSFYQMVLN